MRITKFGHCCLLIEEKGLRILTDPGAYSTGQENVHNVDIALITHDHSDHYHIESLKTVFHNDPQTKIITNNIVKELLEKERIPATLPVHDGILKAAGIVHRLPATVLEPKGIHFVIPEHGKEIEL